MPGQRAARTHSARALPVLEKQVNHIPLGLNGSVLKDNQCRQKSVRNQASNCEKAHAPPPGKMYNACRTEFVHVGSAFHCQRSKDTKQLLSQRADNGKYLIGNGLFWPGEGPLRYALQSAAQ
jgi:hypothetical protein